ncbi:MAG: AAA family ATPase [Candidatus Sulfotelmatobacter sp.]
MTMTAKDSAQHPALDFSPNEPISLVGVCLDGSTSESLRVFAKSASFIIQRNIANYRVEDYDSIFEWIGDPPPDVCLVDFDQDPRGAAIVAQRIHSESRDTAVYAVSSQSEPDAIIQAMRSGCREYLVKPINQEQLLNAMARVGGQRREKKEHHNARVLTFMGAKGGCGVTTLVTQMAALLVNSCSRKSLVVDLHPDFGDAALYMGLTKYGYHFFELLENTERLDAELLQSFVVHHSSGVDIIPAPAEIEPTRTVIPGSVGRTFDFLKQRYEFILVDVPPGMNEENLELIRQCDQLYIVTVAEVSALRNVVRQVEYLRRKQVPQEKIRVVLNRHQKHGLITDEQIEKVIQQKIYWKVPNQYVQVLKTISGGNPIGNISSNEFTRTVTGWAEAVGRKQTNADESKDKKKHGRGIMGLWGR